MPGQSDTVWSLRVGHCGFNTPCAFIHSAARTGQAVEIIFITMLFYLSVSLATALLMNWFNHATAIRER